MLGKYVNIRTLIAKLYRDLSISTEIPENNVIEWCAEVLEKIGTYAQYTQNKECLQLVDGKAVLPINFHKIIDIAYNNKPLSWANNSLYSEYSCEGCTIPTCCSEFTFYINDSYIVTNIASTDSNEEDNYSLCIVYLGIPVDEEGYPMIPDDVYFMEACAKYVTYKLDYIEWRKGNLADKIIQKSEYDYIFYCGAAKGSANTPSTAQLENYKRQWVKLIPNMNQYNEGFKNLNIQERRRLF